MICKFCAAEMLRIILNNQECCAKRIDTKNEMLTVELIKYIQILLEEYRKASKSNVINS